MPAPCNALATSMPPCSPPSLGRWRNDLLPLKRRSHLSLLTPSLPEKGHSRLPLVRETWCSSPMSRITIDDSCCICEAPRHSRDHPGMGKKRHRRHNEHLYKWCITSSHSTGRIVPTLRRASQAILTMRAKSCLSLVLKFQSQTGFPGHFDDINCQAIAATRAVSIPDGLPRPF